jgi:hypothetical protein
MKSTLTLAMLCGLAAVVVMPGAVLAGTIVPDLNDANAVEYTIPDSDDDIDSGVLANGLTLAVRATLNATDVANSATGCVNLLEIGGTTSGTGLVVVNGSYFITGSSGNPNAEPTSVLDVDGSDGGIGVAIGAVTPGIENEVFFSLDNANSRLVVGIDGVYTELALTGVGAGWNWKGNGTITFAGNNDTDTAGNFGWRGGQTDDATDGVFYNMNAVDPTGTVALGQYFNEASSVPEPASLALLTLGMGMLFRRRGS